MLEKKLPDPMMTENDSPTIFDPEGMKSVEVTLYVPASKNTIRPAVAADLRILVNAAYRL